MSIQGDGAARLASEGVPRPSQLDILPSRSDNPAASAFLACRAPTIYWRIPPVTRTGRLPAGRLDREQCRRWTEQGEDESWCSD
jgi:hypothetical protein